MLGDRAVEALHVLAADVGVSVALRQLPLFGDVDRLWLEDIQRGLVGLTLRIAFLLHAEQSGRLPLGRDAYDRHLAITPLADGRTPGAWKRVMRLSRVLSGEGSAPGGLSIRAWRSALFRDSWLRAFSPREPARPNGEVLAPSDDALARAVGTLMHSGGKRLSFAGFRPEQIAGLYERLLGYDVVRCSGRCGHAGLARVIVDLDRLLDTAPERRLDWLRDLGYKPDRGRSDRIVAAATFDELVGVLLGRRKVLIAPGTIVLQPNLRRRRAGAHYTPTEVTEQVVRAALAPLLGREPSSEQILALRICDPSMGTAAFLNEACRQLGNALAEAWRREGKHAGESSERLQRARFEVASRVLYGVDLDPVAVELARAALQMAAAVGEEMPDTERNLRWGDALVGFGKWESPRSEGGGPFRLDDLPGGRAACRSARRGREAGSHRPRPVWDRARAAADQCVDDFYRTDAAAASGKPPTNPRGDLLYVAEHRNGASATSTRHPFHWPLEFPEVFAQGGFDAFIGNPPWVAFAGRAAQPLDRADHRYFAHVSDAFRGYRTLQGLFVHRCASLLRAGGRLGLVVPTSMADLAGYGPVRLAHDALCETDAELPDFGADAFEEVFQPAMALLSTRRAMTLHPQELDWPLRRDDVEPWARELLERLARLPRMPREAFGERGFQSTREDAAFIRRTDRPEGSFATPLREGTDVRPFEALPPRHHIDPIAVGKRLRPAQQFVNVDVLIRQTARYPIAALADGVGFRNSVLAGFGVEGWKAGGLAAYLNAWPIRWLHYTRFRDARQGMPQVKVLHLRSLPCPSNAPMLARLNALGERVGRRNAGIDVLEQEELDAVVGEMLGLCSDELARIQDWRRNNGFE